MRRLRADNINTPEHYNKKYEREIMDNPPPAEFAKRLQMVEGIENGMKVVELGCGMSNLAKYIKEEYPFCEVHALDFADQVVEEFKNQLPNINYQVGDATKTPYPDNYFDYVVAGELIEHIKNPEDLIKEMARICRKDGVISVSTPFAEKTWRPDNVPEEHLWAFDKDDLIILFSKYGEATTKLFIDRFDPRYMPKIHIVVNCRLCPK